MTVEAICSHVRDLEAFGLAVESCEGLYERVYG